MENLSADEYSRLRTLCSRARISDRTSFSQILFPSVIRAFINADALASSIKRSTVLNGLANQFKSEQSMFSYNQSSSSPAQVEFAFFLSTSKATSSARALSFLSISACKDIISLSFSFRA